MGNLTKGKHIVQEINGIRCTVIESGISKARMQFLKETLEFNKLEVVAAEDKAAETDTEVHYTLGVTNLIFNPVIAMYARKLMLPDGRILTPAYWNQDTDYIDPRYWRFRVKQA
jgi:hypothetical protein